MPFSNPLQYIREHLTVTSHNHKLQSQITLIEPTEALTILSSERRRHTIEYLADQPPDTAIETSDIAETVAAKEYNCTVEELSPEDRRRVYISLHQQHLPTLEGVAIEYHPDRQEVTPTTTPACIWRAFSAFCNKLDG